MKLNILIFILFIPFVAVGQAHLITGKVIDERNLPIATAEINVSQKTVAGQIIVTNETGNFKISVVRQGLYYINIKAYGYHIYTDSFVFKTNDIHLATIKLHPLSYVLNEVKVVQKAMAIVQKDDILEFSSDAFKVNPDADAADLIKKMPSIQINDKQVTAQGESVTKVCCLSSPRDHI